MFRVISIWNGVYGFSGKKKRVKYMETCIIKDLFPKIKAVKLGSRNTILLL